ncbi:hypothetical protein [Niabella beijingensis]|uniref:hypothetical protein n=1 Tax=Niabella beijingensis TaxID=2872700 RepID=UPI001CBFC89A|nr:hypothetical protein [Niabella beijingensis]MBZ4188875.1 hypothetical protein [Niabella beijingensis]
MKRKWAAFYFLWLLTGPFPGMAARAGCDHPAGKKIPVVVVTDLYYPAQDPGDNFDLIMGYALPEIDLKAVLLDATEDFRKDSSFVFNLFHQRGGPREPGIIPVTQLNYIFNRAVPYGVGPMLPMRTPGDKMTDLPAFQQQGVQLLIKILQESSTPVDILSFGSARIPAVAYNRAPELFKKKVRMIHLSGGNSSYKRSVREEGRWNKIPGGEWNVALDTLAFRRLLTSDLPLSVYPCAGKKGVFETDHYNTYWKLKSLEFIHQMAAPLKNYLGMVFNPKARFDFLRVLDGKEEFSFPQETHHVWETAVWLNVSGRVLVRDPAGDYHILPGTLVKPADTVISYAMRPCRLTVFDNGAFDFRIVDHPANKWIYYRSDPEENEKAFQRALPLLYLSFLNNTTP